MLLTLLEVNISPFLTSFTIINERWSFNETIGYEISPIAFLTSFVPSTIAFSSSGVAEKSYQQFFLFYQL